MVLAVLTARLSNGRIPNKVLADLCGRPLLDWITDRLLKSKVNRVALAIPDDPKNERLYDWALTRPEKIWVTTGKEDDVVDRIHQCAWEHQAKKVLRITGDLPFLSYEGIDAMIDALDWETDYLNNVYSNPPWLDGTSAEIAWYDAVARANRLTPCGAGHQVRSDIRVDGSWRSHGMHWMANSPDFRRKFISGPCDVTGLPKLLVDEPGDLRAAEVVMSEVLRREDDSYAGLLEIVREKRAEIEAARAG